jgi:hypothetical protein
VSMACRYSGVSPLSCRGVISSGFVGIAEPQFNHRRDPHPCHTYDPIDTATPATTLRLFQTNPRTGTQ